MQPAGDIVSALAKRGCVDLTSSINLAACGDHALAGGGFCDVYQGELYDGTKIAIKSLRIFGPDAESQRKKILKVRSAEYERYKRALTHAEVARSEGIVSLVEAAAQERTTLDGTGVFSWPYINDI